MVLVWVTTCNRCKSHAYDLGDLGVSCLAECNGAQTNMTGNHIPSWDEAASWLVQKGYASSLKNDDFQWSYKGKTLIVTNLSGTPMIRMSSSTTSYKDNSRNNKFTLNRFLKLYWNGLYL